MPVLRERLQSLFSRTAFLVSWARLVLSFPQGWDRVTWLASLQHTPCCLSPHIPALLSLRACLLASQLDPNLPEKKESVEE